MFGSKINDGLLLSTLIVRRLPEEDGSPYTVVAGSHGNLQVPVRGSGHGWHKPLLDRLGGGGHGGTGESKCNHSQALRLRILSLDPRTGWGWWIWYEPLLGTSGLVFTGPRPDRQVHVGC